MSSWIDGSQVYGISKGWADIIRSGEFVTGLSSSQTYLTNCHISDKRNAIVGPEKSEDSNYIKYVPSVTSSINLIDLYL